MNSKTLTYLFSGIYLVIAIVVISVKLLNLAGLENIFKPLLLFTLILWFSVNSFSLKHKINLIFIAALFFSLLGDVFLMPYFDNFILGLVFFLISHLFYILVFIEKGHFLSNLNKSKSLAIIIFCVYAVLLLLLMPDIIKSGDMVLMIAVPIYATVLLFMVLSTISYSKTHLTVFGRYVMLGGIFFLASDGILALNKFSFSIPYSPVWVMGTYTIAQWLLVYGFINSKKTV